MPNNYSEIWYLKSAKLIIKSLLIINKWKKPNPKNKNNPTLLLVSIILDSKNLIPKIKVP